jgi:hypothetical protein
MTDPARNSFPFPAVRSRKVTAAFDGGAITSDAGVLLLAQAERRLGILDRLAALIPDGRDPSRVLHSVRDVFRARVLAIARGYEDADDPDAPRYDPAFMTALGKAPGEAVGLAGQPTMSRWENASDLRALIRIGREMVDVCCASHAAAPAAVTLDIDDTFDAAHGQQQLAFWNGFHGERGYAPIHVCEAGSGRPVAFVLRPARTPSGKEIRGHVRRLIRRIRSHWPDTRIALRGDGHYPRPEVMDWCEAHGIEYLFGLPMNSALRKDPAIAKTADACAVFRAKRGLIAHREHCETRYAAKSWTVTRRVIARIEASVRGMDIRTVVTSIQGTTPERLCALDYCDRGQAGNLMKPHKTQLESDRTSCMSAAANQMRLILHTAACWLLWTLRQAIPAKGAPETRRVHHPADPPDQDRRPCDRNRDPHPRRLRFCLPGQGPDRPPRPIPCSPGKPKSAGPLTAPPQTAPQARKPQHPNLDHSTRYRERLALA